MPSQVKEKPIIFSGPMIRAILQGTKTQSRRVIKPQPDTSHWKPGYLKKAKEWRPMVQLGPVHHGYDPKIWCLHNVGDSASSVPFTGRKCPYGVPRDRLWVRESYHLKSIGDDFIELIYAANGSGKSHYIDDPRNEDTEKAMEILSRDNERDFLGYHPSIHMPRWASRITLEVVSVRVERIQDISNTDIVAEGITPADTKAVADPWDDFYCRYQMSFIELWDTINKKRGYGWEKNPHVWVVEFKLLNKENSNV